MSSSESSISSPLGEYLEKLEQERAELRQMIVHLLARPKCRNCKRAAKELLDRIKE